MLIIVNILLYKDIDSSCYENDGKTLKKVNDTSLDLKISARCEIISSECFKNLKTLQSFSFEENPNLKTIENQGFYQCSNLSIINLSSCTKLTTISNYAFFECSKVTEILLPNGLKEIQSDAFRSNSLVTTITIPSSVEKIGSSAFSSCSKLTNVTFAEGSNLTSLEDYVFSKTNITSFEIPENVNQIDVDAFSGSNITNITLNPSNHHFSIENSILYSENKNILYFTINKSLENIVIPASVTTLGEKCFSESKLTSIIIPSNVKRIENNAFSSCKNLISVTFLGSLDYIGSGIFSDCNNLEFINFPYSSMIVNSYTFISYYNPKVNMSFTHKTLFSSDAIKRKTNVYVSYLNEQNLIITTNALIMNSNQTIIYEYLGYNIYSIIIPYTVRTIKSSAFENSTSSISFEQNSQLSIIENNAFRNCSNLNKLDFSSNNHLQTIQFSSFKDCSNLVEIIFSSTNLYINNNAFENCTKLAKVINILNIPDQCFSGCSKLKQVTIQENARTIGFRSFENCIALTNIIIPSTVETISEYSFVNCNKLKSITFSQENSLSMIFVNSFSGCDSLQNISNFESNKHKCIDNTLYFKNDKNLDLIYHLSQSLDKVLIVNCTIIC